MVKSRINFCREHDIEDRFATLSIRAFNFFRRLGITTTGDAVDFFKGNTFENIKTYPLSLNFGIVTHREIIEFLHEGENDET